MRRVQHYDLISWGYEYFTEKLHGRHRAQAVELLRLEPGQTVLDVPCGTGANLPLLRPLVGPRGHIVGCDYSPGMLARARTKVTHGDWDNVTLVEADARTLSSQMVAAASGAPEVDAAICMLGLSVVPDWEQVFERMYGLVRPGGRVVVMDLYLDGKRTSAAANRYYQLIARADSRRRFWEPLARSAHDFETIEHNWFGGVAKIVAGTKPEPLDDVGGATTGERLRPSGGA